MKPRRRRFRGLVWSTALLAGILHDGLTTVAELKDSLAADGLNMR